MRKAFAVLLAFAVVFINGITAYSMNSEYLVPEAWINNPEIYSETISKQSNSNVLNGAFKYYFDCQNNILYTYFSVSESSLSDSKCDVRISYTVKSVFDTYAFSVDKNGICDSSKGVSDFFATEQSYNVNSNSDRGLFITAVQINNGCLRNNVGIRLYINGHSYSITDDIQLDVMTEQEAFATQEDLTETQSSVTSQEKTTKPHKITTRKAKNEKSKKHTTKRAYKSYSKKYYSNTANGQLSTTASSEGITQSSDFYYETAMSDTAKYYCIAGVACATVGIVLLCVSCLSRSRKEEEKE